MAILRFLAALGWFLLFVVLLLLAIRNAEPVTLRFYFNQAWQLPLVVLLLLAFVAGAVFGLLACISPLFRQRREIAGLRKELRLRQSDAASAPAGPPVPDAPPPY